MGVPTLEVGYTSAMPRREDHEVRKGHVGHWLKRKLNGRSGQPLGYASLHTTVDGVVQGGAPSPHYHLNN